MRIVKLLSIELKNWRQLKSFKQDFQHGITCIVGPNGVGKSSLLDAIMFSITEEWGEHYKKKSHNIRFGSKGDAYVKASWRINSVDIVIEKDLRKNKSKLTLPDGRVLTAAAAVATELETLFGASRSLLNNAVFVAQGKVDEFLHLTKANWLEYLGQFCDLERIEKIREVLHEQLSKDGQLVKGDTSHDIKQLKLQLIERQSRLREITKIVTRCRADILPDAKKMRSRLSRYKHALVQLSNRKELLKDVATAKLFYVACKRKHNATIVALETELASLEKKKQTFAKHSQTWFQTVQDADRRKSLKADLREHRRKLRTSLTTVSSLTDKSATQQRDVNDIAAQYTTLTRARVDLSEKEKTLERRLTLLRQGVCPTCGGKISKAALQQTVGELDDVSKQLTTSLKAEKDLLQSHTELNNDLQQLTADLDAAKADVAKHRHAIKLRKTELAGLPKIAVSKLKKIKSKLVAATMFHASRNNVSSQLDKLRTIVSDTKAAYVAASTQLAKTKSLHDKYPSTKLLKTKVELLDDKLTKHSEARAKISANKAILEDYQNDVKSLLKRIGRCRQIAKMQKQLTVWLQNLAEWRELLHRDKLQRVIIENYLVTQLTKINNWLGKFNCPFVVELDSDLTLLAKKQNGSVHTVKQLSGGQKTMLAIAFRLAANEQSLLVLDEPTAGVDSDKLDKFAEFLSELSVQLKREGRQLLLVTHDDRLLGRSINHRKAVFDNVIRFT